MNQGRSESITAKARPSWRHDAPTSYFTASGTSANLLPASASHIACIVRRI